MQINTRQQMGLSTAEFLILILGVSAITFVFEKFVVEPQFPLIELEQNKVSLMCQDNDAYGVTSDGNLGPWLMTSSGPMIGDRAGRVVGQPIQCAEAKKLLNVDTVVEMRTIQAEKCHPQSDLEFAGVDLEKLNKAFASGELKAPAADDQ
jgi:hypothetical protein